MCANRRNYSIATPATEILALLWLGRASGRCPPGRVPYTPLNTYSGWHEFPLWHVCPHNTGLGFQDKHFPATSVSTFHRENQPPAEQKPEAKAVAENLLKLWERLLSKSLRKIEKGLGKKAANSRPGSLRRKQCLLSPRLGCECEESPSQRQATAY